MEAAGAAEAEETEETEEEETVEEEEEAEAEGEAPCLRRRFDRQWNRFFTSFSERPGR